MKSAAQFRLIDLIIAMIVLFAGKTHTAQEPSSRSWQPTFLIKYVVLVLFSTAQ